MSAWSPRVPVNGALVDFLVTDYGGGVFGPTIALPADCRLCLVFNYSSDAQTQVQIYLAPAPAAAPQDIVMVHDSAAEPVPDATQYLTGVCVDVPIAPGTLIPMFLFITKAASTANIRWATTVKMGPGC